MWREFYMYILVNSLWRRIILECFNLQYVEKNVVPYDSITSLQKTGFHDHFYTLLNIKKFCGNKADKVRLSPVYDSLCLRHPHDIWEVNLQDIFHWAPS